MKVNDKYKIKIIIAITIIGASIVAILQSFITPENKIYTYNINQNTDYKVYIKRNDFINKNVIEKNNVYIQQLVDYINTTFEYQYYASKKSNLDYIYNITSTLKIDYTNTNQNIINKTEDIIKDKTLAIKEENKINISETLNIDYQMYKNEIEKFRQTYQIPVKGYLILDFNIKTGIQLSDNDEKTYEESHQQLVIDLTQPVFEIVQNNSENKQEHIVETNQYNKYLIYIFITIIVIGIIYTVKLVKENEIKNMGTYKITLNTILRKYSDVIVEIKEISNLNIENTVEVKDFNELLDVEEEIREPILLYEKDETAIFLIISNNIKYKYELKNRAKG